MTSINKFKVKVFCYFNCNFNNRAELIEINKVSLESNSRTKNEL